MRKSTIPFFLINLAFLALLLSCGVNPAKGLTAAKLEKSRYDVAYFSDAKADYVYKTNISVYGNALSGILIFKKINDSVHRIVFTTEFGNKLMDLELGEKTFKTNFIVAELDRKILINTLKEDFRLLLRPNFPVQQQMENANDRIYISSDGTYTDYIFETKSTGNLHQIIHATKRKQKFNIGFTTENNIFAKKILIRHDNIKLTIELNALENQ